MKKSSCWVGIRGADLCLEQSFELRLQSAGCRAPLSGTPSGRGRVKLFCICSMHPCNPHRSSLPLLFSPPPLPLFVYLLPSSPRLAPSPERAGRRGRFYFWSFLTLPKKTFRGCVTRFLYTRCEVLISFLFFRLLS